MFVALGLLRIHGREARAIGAAMPPMLVRRAATGRVEEVPLKGMLLGTDFDLPRVETVFTLEPGDRVLLMTDGYVEQFDAADDMMDYERCTAHFTEAADRSPEETLDHLFDRLDAFRGDIPQGDDVTCVVVEVNA